MSDAALEPRFARHLATLLPESESGPSHLLLAFSGGLDSTVLLHLLRFRTPEGHFTLSAAHFDHRMRDGSASDAAWARGVCSAWGIAFEAGAAEGPIHNESEARRARYAFLHAAAARLGTHFLLTAHHADDQAETVLFRVLRGTGIGGLRGIPARTSSGLVRPLLPFWREDLEEYARSSGLRWRSDVTNDSLTPARNRIRKALLPEIERTVAPSARRNLVSLAELAVESEAGWRSVAREGERAVLRHEEDTVVVAREVLRGYHPAVRTRILRSALRRFGTVPDRIGTRSALTFITDAPSGREFQLPGGLRIRTEFDLARIERVVELPEDRPLVIERQALDRESEGQMRIGGRSYTVTLRPISGSEVPREPSGAWVARLPVASLHFPLTLRGRRPGDRISTSGGTKPLKKLMLERRVPLAERDRRPVLEDSTGEVLWVAGVAAGPAPRGSPGELLLHLAIHDDGGG
ncbi:MAG: tRNA lysidine(34) synthetase TilS [Gemmatimonadota bacterium]